MTSTGDRTEGSKLLRSQMGNLYNHSQRKMDVITSHFRALEHSGFQAEMVLMQFLKANAIWYLFGDGLGIF